jgi:hypothetical protein
MSMSCGCGKPDDDHDNSRNITRDDLKQPDVLPPKGQLDGFGPLTSQNFDLAEEEVSEDNQVSEEFNVINGGMRHYRVEYDTPEEDVEDQHERTSLKYGLGPQTSANEHADKENDPKEGRVNKKLVSVDMRMHQYNRDCQTKEDDDEAIPNHGKHLPMFWIF